MKYNDPDRSPSDLNLQEIAELIEQGRKLHNQAIFETFASLFKKIIFPFQHMFNAINDAKHHHNKHKLVLK